jgi:hypothetical protein
MIRAHLATFPPRSGILMQVVAAILPQVDRLCICLNEYQAVPQALADEPKIEALIPDRDLKDAGKFAFVPAADDVVFTIDDDILYPPDYVSESLRYFRKLDPARHVVGHLGHAFLPGAAGAGWKNWPFRRKNGAMRKVDLIGTGTCCQAGQIFPTLAQVETSAGFVDLRHAALHAAAGRWLWVLPHGDRWMTSLMTADLRPTSLLASVNQKGGAAMQHEVFTLLGSRTPHSGERFRSLKAKGLLQAAPDQALTRAPEGS